MRLIFAMIGTFLGITFILQLLRGQKYNPLFENLDSEEFPLASFYVVGYAWSMSGMFPFDGKQANKLRGEAAILYEPQYADYYGRTYWSMTLTLVHLILTFAFLLGAVMYSSALLIVGGGVFMAILMGSYCLSKMESTLNERTEKCESELPEVVSTMAILVNSGMMLRDAWFTIADTGEGEIYKLMRQSRGHMESGKSDIDAIFMFGKASNSQEIRKFTSSLMQSMDKGGGELEGFLMQQSQELWYTKRQKMLQEGEKAATKLLGPIMLIFMGIIIIIMTAAFAGSLF